MSQIWYISEKCKRRGISITTPITAMTTIVQGLKSTGSHQFSNMSTSHLCKKMLWVSSCPFIHSSEVLLDVEKWIAVSILLNVLFIQIPVWNDMHCQLAELCTSTIKGNIVFMACRSYNINQVTVEDNRLINIFSRRADWMARCDALNRKSCFYCKPFW
jgi:hypothetical protein